MKTYIWITYYRGGDSKDNIQAFTTEKLAKASLSHVKGWVRSWYGIQKIEVIK